MVGPNHLEPQISQMIADGSETPAAVLCENLCHLRFYSSTEANQAIAKWAAPV
jgi:hypothetical protein